MQYGKFLDPMFPMKLNPASELMYIGDPPRAGRFIIVKLVGGNIIIMPMSEA